MGLVIKTTAYHLGRYEPSSPSTKELNGHGYTPSHYFPAPKSLPSASVHLPMFVATPNL